jgi:hypothetical protein
MAPFGCRHCPRWGICEEKGVPLYLTKDANHSLECGKAMKDIKTIKKVMRTVKKFL